METARYHSKFPRWRPADILDLIEPEIAPFDPPNMKWVRWPIVEIWPFEIQLITRGAFWTPILFEGRWGCRGSSIVPMERTMAISYTYIRFPLWPLRYLQSFGRICHRISVTFNATGGHFGSKILGCSLWSRTVMLGSAESRVPRRQPHRRSGLATPPSVGAVL